jgi:hypothetical protein
VGYGFEMDFEPISEKGMGFFVLEGVIDIKELLDLQIHSGTCLPIFKAKWWRWLPVRER